MPCRDYPTPGFHLPSGGPRDHGVSDRLFVFDAGAPAQTRRSGISAALVVHSRYDWTSGRPIARQAFNLENQRYQSRYNELHAGPHDRHDGLPREITFQRRRHPRGRLVPLPQQENHERDADAERQDDESAAPYEIFGVVRL